MKPIIGACIAIVLAASQASAACAWAWWQSTGETIDAVAAYATKQECEQALSAYEKKTTQKVNRVLEGNRIMVIQSHDGRDFATMHFCLPDTIDPRNPAPKGK